MRLILASASPRRAELLRAAGLDFEVVATDVDERLRPGESPAAYVRRLAAEKSAAAMGVVRPAEAGRYARKDYVRNDALVVLGADTAVVVDGDVLGKPREDHEAAAMLARLSGRRHEVLTGVSLRADAAEVGCVEATTVEFSQMSGADIAWYVASGEGRDKAGAYAIQGLAARFIPRIEGSYSNVVGLPIAAVIDLLTRLHPTGSQAILGREFRKSL